MDPNQAELEAQNDQRNEHRALQAKRISLGIGLVVFAVVFSLLNKRAAFYNGVVAVAKNYHASGGVTGPIREGISTLANTTATYGCRWAPTWGLYCREDFLSVQARLSGLGSNYTTLEVKLSKSEADLASSRQAVQASIQRAGLVRNEIMRLYDRHFTCPAKANSSAWQSMPLYHPIEPAQQTSAPPSTTPSPTSLRKEPAGTAEQQPLTTPGPADSTTEVSDPVIAHPEPSQSAETSTTADDDAIIFAPIPFLCRGFLSPLNSTCLRLLGPSSQLQLLLDLLILTPAAFMWTPVYGVLQWLWQLLQVLVAALFVWPSMVPYFIVAFFVYRRWRVVELQTMAEEGEGAVRDDPAAHIPGPSNSRASGQRINTPPA